jgi:hypothetical protein
MSSTENPGFERARELFEAHAVPAGEALRERGARLLPEHDPAAESHWERHPGTPLVRADDGANIGDTLAARWSAEGLDELLPLAAGLRELAEELRRTQQEQDEDVSPYIYAMF